MILPESSWAQVTGDWTRHLRLGAQVGLNLKGDFKIGGQYAVSGTQPGAVGVSGVNHTYQDGYVKVDDTQNAGGLTSYWGYENASQVSGGQLLMHSTDSFSTGSSRTSADAGPQIGLDLAYGGELTLWHRTLIGWDFGFGFMPVNVKDKNVRAATLSQSTYAFDISGLSSIPTDPYHGGSSGLGPLIGDQATFVGQSNASGFLGGTRELDYTLYQFRLGPTFYWDLGSRLALQTSLGGAMGLLSGGYRFNETLTTGTSSVRNIGKIDNTDLVYGGYANATLLWRSGEKADLFVSAQFLTLGNSTVSGGGREATLKLGRGVFFSAGINWPF